MMEFIRIQAASAPFSKPARPDFILISVAVLPTTKVGR